ncbi:unnamed protein product, partial [Mesorhabditis belari]|uniref:Uncharacterized protein n=1 Tax=Mesorhabditis belari TaxID=2138241 RepID=A0AAF3J8T5_9BILA
MRLRPRWFGDSNRRLSRGCWILIGLVAVQLRPWQLQVFKSSHCKRLQCMILMIRLIQSFRYENAGCNDR